MGTKKNKIPKDLEPMLATLVNKPIDDSGWLYEVKWDGFRAMAYLDQGKVEIKSRNNKDFNSKFYPINEALQNWKIDAVVDGEIVVVNEKGFPDFAALQTWRSEADGDLIYYLFDLIWYNGEDLSQKPLIERKAILKRIVPKDELIRLSETFDTKGSDFFQLAEKLGLEGLIAKKADSLYQPGHRSKEWLKIKTQKQQEVVIAGYTKNENTSKKFSSLLVGIYVNEELIPLSPVGTGFTTKMQTEILKRLQPLITKKCPFNVMPDFNKPSRFRPDPPKAEITWVKPEVVAEISYRTVSSDGTYRHPSFKGLRDDKIAKDIRVERAENTENIISEREKDFVQNSMLATPGKRERKSLLNPGDQTQVRNINGHELKFSNLDKVFWPKENISKRDVLNYYYKVAPFILPYLQARPQTLNRFPNGVEAKSFYQKDVKGKVPHWIETFEYYSETDKRAKEFLICSTEESLLYVANLGCIEINPWSSTELKPDQPDWCIIDLDPDKNTLDQVVEVACVTKELLDSLSIKAFCKTSGSTGLHIYIPLQGKYTYEDSKEFARSLAKVIHRETAKFTSIERLTSNRKGKLYIDFLQNRPQATVAAPYSLRPRPGAPVSMPLHWEEVKRGLKIQDYNIHNAVDRIKEQGDIFKGVLGKGIDLDKIRKELENL